jgi:hypothetical protein
MRNAFGVLVIGVVIPACATESVSNLSLTAAREILSPAAGSSGEPFLAASSDGSVLMSWIERVDSVHELRFARYTNGSWTAPATIARSSLFFVNWADFPSIFELNDGRLAAHWLARSGPGKYSYDVLVAFSADQGATWSEPVRPHSDDTESEHGFVTLFPHGTALGAVWLDGRKYAEAESNPEAVREMTVRFTTFGDGNVPAPESVVDDRACDCCQTDVALAASGPVLVYRDRSPDEIRDIAVSRLMDGQWTPPVHVHDDGWHINACPVNGPAIAANGSMVAVAWFTAAGDSPRVQLAFSRDGAVSFQAPVRIDTGDPIGRVDLIMLENGAVLVSWLERAGGGTRVVARFARPDFPPGPVITIGNSSEQRASGFPRMAFARDTVFFAWTQPGPPATIQLRAAALSRD